MFEIVWSDNKCKNWKLILDKTSQILLHILYDFKLVKRNFYFNNFNKFNTFLNNWYDLKSTLLFWIQTGLSLFVRKNPKILLGGISDNINKW